MQSSFDTRHLLGVVDALDRFCAQWKGEWQALDALLVITVDQKRTDQSIAAASIRKVP